MEDKKVLKPIEVVELYYNAYKDYKEAYDNVDTKSLQSELKSLVESGEKGEVFKKASMDYINATTNYSAEVMFASAKFLNAADFYLKTNTEDLPEDMTRDFVMLKKEEYRHVYSVKGGKFVSNTKSKPKEIPEEGIGFLFDYFQDMFKRG